MLYGKGSITTIVMYACEILILSSYQSCVLLIRLEDVFERMRQLQERNDSLSARMSEVGVAFIP